MTDVLLPGQPDNPGVSTIRIASYNVHEFVGTDGRRSAARILRVLRDLRADILLLQEVRNSRVDGEEARVLDWFASELGMHTFLGTTLLRADAHYGNACLTRQQPESWQRHDLSVQGREPRGALELCFGRDRCSLRLIATHLGLRPRERRRQYRLLSAIVAAGPAQVTVLGGDFNDIAPPAWFRRKSTGKHSRSRVATFPARWPILPFDRLHVWPPERLVRLKSVRNELTRIASDHLPVVAEVSAGSDERSAA